MPTAFVQYIEAGWLACARRQPSPHCDARPQGQALELLVIHGISLPPGVFGGPWIDALFLGCLDPAAHPYFAGIAHLRVSAHLCIRREGSITQYVPFHRRAWHAGVSRFGGRTQCNDFSIGIELEGGDDIPYTEQQYTRLAEVIHALKMAYPSLVAVTGHADIAPGRKTDPGPAFVWARLAQALACEGLRVEAGRGWASEARLVIMAP